MSEQIKESMKAVDKPTIVNVTTEGQIEAQSHVEIKHTTKGDAWEVKVYSHDPQKAYDEALRIFEDIRQKFEVK
jgi:hypothetical protein